MNSFKGARHIFFLLFSLSGMLSLVNSCQSGHSDIDYNTHVKPILNKHCIACHGGVKQSGGFSLMTRESTFAITDSGVRGIVPGKPDSSELIRRINHHDPEERMPQEADPLSKNDIRILTKWIRQGANWGLHWAYQPITEPNKEKVSKMSFSTGEQEAAPSKVIDELVRKQLDKIGLKPSNPAQKAEILRRLSMDIIGIPAPLALQEKFIDGTLQYSALVDSLLSMTSFGEKWAGMWLDVARYADSKGFERDQNRSIWPYRDYVIKAFNQDKPYDQFIIEQMAGDLLDNPTEEQLIATGFHRNTTTNDEGGTDNEEFRVKAVMDRVNTTWEGLMGTTMACVQCHGHPYDPFPHEEYYKSMAFLNNTRDADTHMDYPRLQLLDSLSQGQLDSLKTWVAQVASQKKADEVASFVKTIQPVIYSIETDELEDADHYDTKYLGLRKNGVARIPVVALENKTILMIRMQTFAQGGILSFHLDSKTGPQIGQLSLKEVSRHYQLKEVQLQHSGGIHDIFIRYTNASLSDPNRPGVQIDWFYFTQDFPGSGHPDYALNRQRFEKLIHTGHDHTLIFIENPSDRRRKTFVFDRGNWLVPGDEVRPDVPAILPSLDEGEKPARLAFARWIVSEENPLTARTFVNRVWEQLFGRGIVFTTEDLGSQGTIPSNQELLDYLSYQWMHQQDWRIKALIKSIVLSDTYRQSAKATAASLEKDPYNEYLSRGPRVRLSAEQVRDQALYISDLLSSKMYGPPVMPYQPDGIWKTPYNNQSWQISEGEDRYRRAIYTMIKRSSVYPSMETFDMSQRQVCASRRIRTNTPLQALVTLNDPVYVEAAQQLAERMVKEGGNNLGEQIDFAYQLAMAKPIPAEKSRILEDLYQEVIETASQENPDAEQMALFTVASALMNLDEFLNN